MAARNDLDWTEDEHLLALDLYFRFNPLTINKKHASVVELSDLLNRLPIHPQALRGEKFRNPDGVYMKLCNFLRLDPSYAGKGLSRGAKGEEVVWNLYSGNRSDLREIADAIRVTGERQIQVRLTQPLDEDEETFPEGRLLTREHKTRERNRQLVERKKKAILKLNGTLECEVCCFDFFKTYGELGREFAECHHQVPLSDLREARETKLSELKIVCANCHRMLHRARPWKTISELKAMISARNVDSKMHE
jgi:5-methylcytosine-specific restriction protein A